MFSIMTMAENIKNCRNEKGWNQYEFAEKLSVSSQAVSKWECGQTCPSIENLCAIAEILGVSVDELIGQAEDRERMLIGIDGSGNKTEFVLFSESGKIHHRLLLEGCNPNTLGMENAINTLETGIDTLNKMTGRIYGIFVGAAGLDSGNNTARIKKMLQEKYSNIRLQCENDVFNVIGCGKNLEQCVAAICSTGIIVYANRKGELRHFGGRGYLLDKGGSGYHIGRDAICAAQDARDGIGKYTMLTDLVEEKLGSTVWDGIQKIYSKNQSYIASFAPCVFRAYESGDRIAAQILEQNAEYLAELINFAVKNCKVGKYVVASGSILKQRTDFQELLKKNLYEEIELDIPEYPSVYGSCVMCCRMCGLDASPIKERFMTSYQQYQ